MKQLNTTELAYIAGLFDGEGCVLLQKVRGGQGYGLHLEIKITYVPTLEFIRDTYGGTLIVVKKRPPRKQAYGWYLHGKEVHNFLLAVLPYLREKKVQALLVDQYCKEIGVGHSSHRIRSDKVKQEWYYKELQRLKTIEYAPGSTPATTIESPSIEQLRLVE
jgi:hypothetical protein